MSVFAGEDLERVQMAVVGKLLRHSIDKTKLQIRRNEDLFHEALIKTLPSKKQQALKSRAETLVRLCDSIIGLVLEQSEWATKLGGAHGEALMEEGSIQVNVRVFPVANDLFRDPSSKRVVVTTSLMFFEAEEASQKAMHCLIVA